MGIAAVFAENERLRQELAARDQALAARDEALADRDAQIAALTVSNEDLANRLELIRLNAAARRNQRHVAARVGTALLPPSCIFSVRRAER